MFPIDTGALVSAWEEATKCLGLSQGWAFTPYRVRTEDRNLLTLRSWTLLHFPKNHSPAHLYFVSDISPEVRWGRSSLCPSFSHRDLTWHKLWILLHPRWRREPTLTSEEVRGHFHTPMVSGLWEHLSVVP